MTINLKKELHSRLITHLDLRNFTPRDNQAEEWMVRAERHLTQEIKKLGIDPFLSEALKTDVLDEVFAYGPLTSLLADPTVTEIMVNGAEAVFVERNGKITASDARFLGEETLRSTIDRIVSLVNRRLDESSPFVDARLPDGSRVNAIIPPVSLTGPCLTIRKFRGKPFPMNELVDRGALSREAAEYLMEAVRMRRNIIVSGGTGTGKTTILNALSTFIPDEERIVTIEDAAEITLDKPHVVRLESRPPNIEGNGSVTIRDLVRNSLRMRPDRIIVGECRGGEALDMLQAMNTGHDGSITTGHANSPRDILRRLETMVLLGGIEIPIRAIREQIASAIDIIVQLSRFPDGTRGLTSIAEVSGLSDNQVMLQELFTRQSRTGGSLINPLVRTAVPSSLENEEWDSWV